MLKQGARMRKDEHENLHYETILFHRKGVFSSQHQHSIDVAVVAIHDLSFMG